VTAAVLSVRAGDEGLRLQFFDGTMKGIPIGVEAYIDSIAALQSEAPQNPH
jgi:hypothetical protein